MFKYGERKVYDMKPHLNGPLFGSLNDINLFNKVCVRFDTIEWENGAYIDPEVLYREGELLTPTSAFVKLAVSLKYNALLYHSD